MKNKFTTSSIYKEANRRDYTPDFETAFSNKADDKVEYREQRDEMKDRHREDQKQARRSVQDQREAASDLKREQWRENYDLKGQRPYSEGVLGSMSKAVNWLPRQIEGATLGASEWYDERSDATREHRREREDLRDQYKADKRNLRQDQKSERKNEADDVVFVEDMENMESSGSMEELMSLVDSVFDEGALEVKHEVPHMDEDLSAEEVLNNVTETLDEAGDLADEFEEFAKKVPGSDMFEDDMEDKEPKETNYLDDGDLAKFLDHVKEVYPAKIPQHDGKSMLGCERAISWLDRLSSEISKNIRMDTDSLLDIHELEQIRVRIMSDVLALKGHLGKLKKKFKESNSKTASVDNSGVPNWIDASGNEVSYDQLTKEASTPRKMVIAVSPFERAISGILINAHVSGGHPMEEVYGFLSEKYSIEPREELSIMQVCMDSGFPIFKDRGTYSGNDNKEESRKGVDFVKNYFA